ncbi:MAG: hypothetical protein JWQ83_566, partial [Lacunisphaera sp.]|nr:hypothetical protein [Lacunisphaera sp.]
MKKYLPWFVVSSVLLFSTMRAADPVPTADSESPAAKEKRLEWFRHDKFGLFIHWGLYAIPAGYWKGQRSPGIG